MIAAERDIRLKSAITCRSRTAGFGQLPGAGSTTIRRMAIDKNTFWGSNHYEHPPLTDETLGRAEGALGVRLPTELIELLRIQNGGYTEGFALPMSRATSWASDHIPLDELNGIVLDPTVKTALNLMDTAYMTAEWDLPPQQVLLAGAGHYWITLDYRNGPAPSVAWIDIDSGEDFQVADSFAAFLSNLVPASVYEPPEE